MKESFQQQQRVISKQRAPLPPELHVERFYLWGMRGMVLICLHVFPPRLPAPSVRSVSVCVTRF